jgi:hypothetical protein
MTTYLHSRNKTDKELKEFVDYVKSEKNIPTLIRSLILTTILPIRLDLLAVKKPKEKYKTTHASTNGDEQVVIDMMAVCTCGVPCPVHQTSCTCEYLGKSSGGGNVLLRKNGCPIHPSKPRIEPYNYIIGRRIIRDWQPTTVVKDLCYRIGEISRVQEEDRTKLEEIIDLLNSEKKWEV